MTARETAAEIDTWAVMALDEASKTLRETAASTNTELIRRVLTALVWKIAVKVVLFVGRAPDLES